MSIPGKTDKKLAEDAREDLRTYTAAMQRGDTAACVKIEKKYGMYGLSPEKVSNELFEIGAPALQSGRVN